MTARDPRLEAFLSEPTEIFHSVQHRHELWKEDPFDVTSVHAEAREAFERLLHRPRSEAGRILLVLGESGAGKTHLMRAFRQATHEQGLGFVGYMQMTTQTADYGRYVLTHLVESLDHPYNGLQSLSALHRLAKALHGRCGNRLADLLTGEAALEEGELQNVVVSVADSLLAQPGYGDLDLDLVRALLFLEHDDPRLKSRVLKWLRCEELSPADRRLLGELVPRTKEGDPQRMVESLGRLMATLEHSLVLCVDQLEDMYDEHQASPPFRTAMRVLTDLMDRVPSLVIVISCLRDFWSRMSGTLNQSTRDRIEQDPEPLVLTSLRSAGEARQLVIRRLEHLYDVAGVDAPPSDPTFPFPSRGFEALAGLRTRDVLDACRRFRERARALGELPSTFPLEGGALSPAAPTLPAAPASDLERAWDDYRVSHRAELPEAEGDLQALLAWALRTAGSELRSGRSVEVASHGAGLHVDLAPGAARLLVALCNKSPKAGALGKQLQSATKAAADRTLVVVRSTPYPDSPRSAVATQLGQLIRQGGRRVVLEDSEVRTALALRDFLNEHASRPQLEAWRLDARPLTRLKALREILDLDRARPATASQPAVKRPQPEESRAIAPAADPREEPMLVGRTLDLLAQPVALQAEELTRHAAFLGGSGSGKTTVALNLVEQLLLRGVPAILVDRKGDLAGYAHERFAHDPPMQPSLAVRRDELVKRVDFAVFTPGHPRGRPLGISALPRGLVGTPDFEREQACEHAAQALAGMMGLKPTGKDKSCRAILAQAVSVLLQMPSVAEPSLPHLIQIIDERNPALVSRVGALDDKLFDRLVQELQTLVLSAKALLAPAAESLDVDLLLGLGEHATPGKTRLSVVSTKFLGDNAQVLFWVSQLVGELSRWTSQHPAKQLQALLLLDEADLYLPASGIPATKQPIESLLKRARSAGLGVLLATQSPGDLDYKCRDNIRSWFVGRVAQTVALEKMKPMLAESKLDASAKIAGQAQGEFHLLREGRVERMKAEPSALRTEQLSEDELLVVAGRTAGTPPATTANGSAP